MILFNYKFFYEENYVKKVIFSLLDIIQADFVRNDDKQIVIDSLNNLVWQDNLKTIGSDNKMNWINAKKYCQNLILNEKYSWYLPDITELKSIVDYEKSSPAINSSFVNVQNGNYWSSSIFHKNKNSFLVC